MLPVSEGWIMLSTWRIWHTAVLLRDIPTIKYNIRILLLALWRRVIVMKLPLHARDHVSLFTSFKEETFLLFFSKNLMWTCLSDKRLFILWKGATFFKIFSYSEAFVSELLENIGEMFPRYYMHRYKFSMFKFSNTQ